jgi:hypothetical protein
MIPMRMHPMPFKALSKTFSETFSKRALKERRSAISEQLDLTIKAC